MEKSRNSRGAMSVFLLIIVGSLILLSFLLIDCTRIFVAKNRVEKSIALAGNSLLASYDRRAAEEFGLFSEGSSESARKSLFIYYLKKNLGDQGSLLNIRYFIDEEAIRIQPTGTLISKEELKNQILMNETYRVPGNFLLRVLDSLRSQSTKWETMNENARNEREKKREVERRIGELKSELKTLKDAGKERALAELDTLSEELLRLNGGETKDGPGARLEKATAQDIQQYILGKWQELSGLNGKALPVEWIVPVKSIGTIPEQWTGKEDTEIENEKAISRLRSLIKGLEDVARNGGEKMLLVEYCVDRFSNLLQEDSTRYYPRGETEYIVAGGKDASDVGALAGTLSEMWGLLFTLRFLENFSGSLVPEPFERLALALMEAGVEASTNLLTLINGGNVPFLREKSTGLELSYEDMLRILLWLVPEENILARTQSILNSFYGGQEKALLEGQATGFKISYMVRVNLFFIPYLMPDIGFLGVKGGQYEIFGDVEYEY